MVVHCWGALYVSPAKSTGCECVLQSTDVVGVMTVNGASYLARSAAVALCMLKAGGMSSDTNPANSASGAGEVSVTGEVEAGEREVAVATKTALPVLALRMYACLDVA